MSENTRPTIRDFVPGVPYSTLFVAEFLGVTAMCVRQKIKAGVLKAVETNGGRRHNDRFMIDGAEILRYYGVKEMESLPPPMLPRPGDDLKRARKARRALDKLKQPA